MCTYPGRRDGDEPELEAVPQLLRELYLGPPGESDEQRAARVAAARDVLAELLAEGESDDIAMQDALYAVRLGGAALLRGACRTAGPARARRAV